MLNGNNSLSLSSAVVSNSSNQVGLVTTTASSSSSGIIGNNNNGSSNAGVAASILSNAINGSSVSSSNSSSLKRLLWSPRPYNEDELFIVSGQSSSDIRLYGRVSPHSSPISTSASRSNSSASYQLIKVNNDLPLNFRTLDWANHPQYEDFMAMGLSNGKTILFRLGYESKSGLEEENSTNPSGTVDVSQLSKGLPGATNSSMNRPTIFMGELVPRHARSCNVVSFNHIDCSKLLVGLDKVRNDYCLFVYDLVTSSTTLSSSNATSNGSNSNYYSSSSSGNNVIGKAVCQFGSSETISSASFLSSNHLVAGMGLKWLRVYDIRSSSPCFVFPSKSVFGVTRDPFNEHCFLSHSDDGIVSLWDTRYMSATANLSSTSTTTSNSNNATSFSNSPSAVVSSSLSNALMNTSINNISIGNNNSIHNIGTSNLNNGTYRGPILSLETGYKQIRHASFNPNVKGLLAVTGDNQSGVKLFHLRDLSSSSGNAVVSTTPKISDSSTSNNVNNNSYLRLWKTNQLLINQSIQSPPNSTNPNNVVSFEWIPNNNNSKLIKKNAAESHTTVSVNNNNRSILALTLSGSICFLSSVEFPRLTISPVLNELAYLDQNEIHFTGSHFNDGNEEFDEDISLVIYKRARKGYSAHNFDLNLEILEESAEKKNNVSRHDTVELVNYWKWIKYIYNKSTAELLDNAQKGLLHLIDDILHEQVENHDDEEEENGDNFNTEASNVVGAIETSNSLPLLSEEGRIKSFARDRKQLLALFGSFWSFDSMDDSINDSLDQIFKVWCYYGKDQLLEYITRLNLDNSNQDKNGIYSILITLLSSASNTSPDNYYFASNPLYSFLGNLSLNLSNLFPSSSLLSNLLRILGKFNFNREEDDDDTSKLIIDYLRKGNSDDFRPNDSGSGDTIDDVFSKLLFAVIFAEDLIVLREFIIESSAKLFAPSRAILHNDKRLISFSIIFGLNPFNWFPNRNPNSSYVITEVFDLQTLCLLIKLGIVTGSNVDDNNNKRRGIVTKQLRNYLEIYRDLLDSMGLFLERSEFDTCSFSGSNSVINANSSDTWYKLFIIEQDDEVEEESSGEMMVSTDGVGGKDARSRRKKALVQTASSCSIACIYCGRDLFFNPINTNSNNNASNSHQHQGNKSTGVAANTSSGSGSKKVLTFLTSRSSKNTTTSNSTNASSTNNNNNLIFIKKSCKSCGKPLPRCSVCQCYLNSTSNSTNSTSNNNSNLFNLFIGWCQRCGHGGHVDHLSSWFRGNVECPVSGCTCKCNNNNNLML